MLHHTVLDKAGKIVATVESRGSDSINLTLAEYPAPVEGVRRGLSETLQLDSLRTASFAITRDGAQLFAQTLRDVSKGF